MEHKDDVSCRPLRADAARNRERILVAAGEVFAQRGLDATLDDVADQAGLGVGTVYRRFASKEELVEALFEQAVTEIVALAEAAATMGDSWEGLVWFLERATEMQAEDLGLRDVVLHGGDSESRVSLARDNIVPPVTHLVQRAQRDGFLRPDFLPTDIPIIELMISSVAAYTNAAAPGLWRRYLSLVLDGMVVDRSELRELGRGPTHQEIAETMHLIPGSTGFRTHHGHCCSAAGDGAGEGFDKLPAIASGRLSDRRPRTHL
jgi:AcrR family transcriptional regulator